MPFPQNQPKRLIPAKRTEWPVEPWIPNNPNLTDKLKETGIEPWNQDLLKLQKQYGNQGLDAAYEFMSGNNGGVVVDNGVFYTNDPRSMTVGNQQYNRKDFANKYLLPTDRDNYTTSEASMELNGKYRRLPFSDIPHNEDVYNLVKNYLKLGEAYNYGDHNKSGPALRKIKNSTLFSDKKPEYISTFGNPQIPLNLQGATTRDSNLISIQSNLLDEMLNSENKFQGKSTLGHELTHYFQNQIDGAGNQKMYANDWNDDFPIDPSKKAALRAQGWNITSPKEEQAYKIEEMLNPIFEAMQEEQYRPPGIRPH
jgi:hypothetical protein